MEETWLHGCVASEKRERESAEVWAKRVERWKDSGLKCGEFCAEINVNPRTLMYWAWRLRKGGKREQPVSRPTRSKAPTAERPKQKLPGKRTPPPFVELVSTTPTDGHPVEIVVRIVTVRVPQTAAADLVRRAFDFAEKQK